LKSEGLCGGVIKKFFDHLEGFSEHGIFHGIIDLQENKLLKIKDKKCLFTIEWGIDLDSSGNG